MNKKHILSFLLGVIVTVILMLLFFSFNKDKEIEGTEEVKGLYDRLLSLNYVKDVSDSIDVILEEIESAAKWKPNGNVSEDDVLEGKTFYSNSREMKTGKLSFLGDATVNDVLFGKRFYSDSGELLTGEWEFKGNVLVNQVLSGKTFYSSSGELLTGTYTPPSVSYLGDALVTEVVLGKKFYSNSGTLLTGTYTPPTVSYLGDALVTEVVLGKKFYSDSGTLLTGTYSPIDFTNMQYSTWDDYKGIDIFEWGGGGTEDYQGEESEWTKISDNIWEDERAGLYWSSNQTTTMLEQEPSVPNSNNFTAMSLNTCDYFNSTPRSSYDGTDIDCGNAINWCASLTLDGSNNWYLPSQKELMLAYIDGMYNQAGDTLQEAAEFTIGDGSGGYWSSSEGSLDSTSAWFIISFDADAYYVDKTLTIWDVRCVSRDLAHDAPAPAPVFTYPPSGPPV